MSTVIIAGSRTIRDPETVAEAVKKSGFSVEKVITGGCSGVDALAEQWALSAGIPVAVYMPNWKRYGRGAGPVRNRAMAENADALIAIMPGNGSKGTLSMISEAKKKGLAVYVHLVR